MADGESGALSCPNRRRFMIGAGATAVAAVGAATLWRSSAKQQADVFIGSVDSYTAPIAGIVKSGLAEIGFGRADALGKSVLLKPNLVEPSIDAPHVNTHPLFIRAVAEAFRSLGAREVLVAEGPGHCRDTYLVLDDSGMTRMLREQKLPFIDLNNDDIDVRSNCIGETSLRDLYLPQSLRRADIIVSLPKMKTHHWAGATLSMKNFFGVMPGICYGWPKNVLHREGIPSSIVDIVGTVKPQLAIVDGIIGMDGDGPIMGDPKQMGVVVVGRNLPAVDATCCRLMNIDPSSVEYLMLSAGRLGPIDEGSIQQRGESIASMAKTFRLLDGLPFRRIRSA